MTRIVTRSFLKNTFRLFVGWALPTTSGVDCYQTVGRAHPTFTWVTASSWRKCQRGFALPAAIFIVVVLGFLGVMMVTLGGMERATASTAAQAARAYQAAHAGIEWGVYHAVPLSGASSCAASTPFTLSVSGLNGFAVTVQCAVTQHRERGNDINVYTITAIATSGVFGNSDYVARTLNVTVTDAPPP